MVLQQQGKYWKLSENVYGQFACVVSLLIAGGSNMNLCYKNKRGAHHGAGLKVKTHATLIRM